MSTSTRVSAAQVLVAVAAIRLEARGLKHSRGSVTARWRKVLGMRPGTTRDEVLEVLEAVRAELLGETTPEPAPAALACPMCDGSGYVDNGTREPVTCSGCDGSGRGVRCACGDEIVPAGSRVAHVEGDEACGDGEEVHTPERCARFSARNGWEEFRAYDTPTSGSERDWLLCHSMSAPDWCEQYIGGGAS